MAMLKAAAKDSWSQVFKRVSAARIGKGWTWDELAKKAGIRVKSWMTGIPATHPTDAEVRKIAAAVGTTYEWLRYGEGPDA